MSADPRTESLRRAFDWPAIVHDLAHHGVVLDTEVAEVLGETQAWRGATPQETERIVGVISSHYRRVPAEDDDVRCELCGVPVAAPPADRSGDVLCPECREVVTWRRPNLFADSALAWRAKFYAVLLEAEVCRRGLGLLRRFRTPDAPEAARMADAATAALLDGVEGGGRA